MRLAFYSSKEESKDKLGTWMPNHKCFSPTKKVGFGRCIKPNNNKLNTLLKNRIFFIKPTKVQKQNRIATSRPVMPLELNI